MVVDFDLGRSFVMRGRTVAQNGLLFKPVVRATAQDRTGALAGVVVADSAAGAPLADATGRGAQGRDARPATRRVPTSWPPRRATPPARGRPRS
jgi:hypothetical protein